MFREIHETMGESISAARNAIDITQRIRVSYNTFDPDKRIDVTKRIVVRETAEYDPDKRIVVED